MRPLLPLLVLLTAGLRAGPPSQTVVLWPKGAPGETDPVGPERDTSGDQGRLVAGRRVIRLGGVSEPSIALYAPPKEKATGAAVVVCPGGGYNILALDLEGAEVCDWLNSIGVAGILLKYRVPAKPGTPRAAAPLQDAQRALGIARSRAASWGIDPARIGILGFSAGGHLSALASTSYRRRSYPPVDEADAVSCRPDFALLIYPAYLAIQDEDNAIAAELAVDPATPATFLLQTGDDGVRVENSVFFYMALKKAGVAAELHVFPTGSHGYGLRRTEAAVTEWPALAARWLVTTGVLKPAR